MTRGAMPRRFAIEVATASVGLRIAPSATPRGKPTEGITSQKNTPSARALPSTSTIARPEIVRKSRRNSIAGNCTAAENSSGGSTPTRITSGGTVNVGTNGNSDTPMPITTRISGPATRVRCDRAVTTAITMTAATAIKTSSSGSTGVERTQMSERSRSFASTSSFDGSTWWLASG